MTPDDQLNLRSRHPDFQYFPDINESESERVRKSHQCYLDEKYGEAPIEYYEYPELNHYQIAHALGQENSLVANFVLEKAK